MEGNALLACDNNYFFTKLYQSYVFSNNIDETIKQLANSSVVFNEDSLINYLEELVDENCDFNYLDKHVKNNIFSLIQFLRNSEEYRSRDNYNEIVDILNNMINKLNRSNEENVAEFYGIEITERINFTNNEIRRIKTGRLELIPEEIRQMMCLDIIVLLNLNADDESYKGVFEDLVYNDLIICSIRKMLSENPKMFRDERIYKRTKDILMANCKLIFNEKKNYDFCKENIKIYRKLQKTQKDK